MYYNLQIYKIKEKERKKSARHLHLCIKICVRVSVKRCDKIRLKYWHNYFIQSGKGRKRNQ